MKKLAIILFLFGSVQTMKAQDFDTEKHKEVAFNMTTLASKLVPFNAASRGFQNYAMQFRFGVNTERPYFVSAFGFNMNTLENDENLLHFDARIGLETRKTFGENWIFGNGFNLVAYVHEIEEQQIFFGDEVEGGLAFDKSFMLGYQFNKHISIFTETSLQFGISSASFIKLQFLSPNAIYLNVKF